MRYALLKFQMVLGLLELRSETRLMQFVEGLKKDKVQKENLWFFILLLNSNDPN